MIALEIIFKKNIAIGSGLKQDYTPNCICNILSRLQPKTNKLIDVCTGTGALTISSYNNQKDIYYQCEELSSRSIPVLLFNLAIRGMSGKVYQKNILTNEINNIYLLVKKDKYSDIEKLDCDIEQNKFDVAISNPPYSLSWTPKYDDRFNGYDLAPKSKADYAFVLDIIYRLSDKGIAFFILPHGVLFRGQAEGNIRKQLIENNLIDSVIGLPAKLFMNTQIPTCILIIKKNKENKDILFIDSSKQYKEQGKQNDMLEEHINKIIDTYNQRKEIEKYSSVIQLDKIKENDYNLNIPRYVDTSEPEIIPDLKECVKDIIEVEKEIKQTRKELKPMIEQLRGTTEKEQQYYEESIKPLLEWLED